jgi:hypothetical protein
VELHLEIRLRFEERPRSGIDLHSLNERAEEADRRGEQSFGRRTVC